MFEPRITRKYTDQSADDFQSSIGALYFIRHIRLIRAIRGSFLHPQESTGSIVGSGKEKVSGLNGTVAASSARNLTQDRTIFL